MKIVETLKSRTVQTALLFGFFLGLLPILAYERCGDDFFAGQFFAFMFAIIGGFVGTLGAEENRKLHFAAAWATGIAFAYFTTYNVILLALAFCLCVGVAMMKVKEKKVLH